MVQPLAAHVHVAQVDQVEADLFDERAEVLLPGFLRRLADRAPNKAPRELAQPDCRQMKAIRRC
jgi:hypothetical protein